MDSFQETFEHTHLTSYLSVLGRPCEKYFDVAEFVMVIWLFQQP